MSEKARQRRTKTKHRRSAAPHPRRREPPARSKQPAPRRRPVRESRHRHARKPRSPSYSSEGSSQTASSGSYDSSTGSSYSSSGRSPSPPVKKRPNESRGRTRPARAQAKPRGKPKNVEPPKPTKEERDAYVQELLNDEELREYARPAKSSPRGRAVPSVEARRHRAVRPRAAGGGGGIDQPTALMRVRGSAVSDQAKRRRKPRRGPPRNPRPVVDPRAAAAEDAQLQALRDEMSRPKPMLGKDKSALPVAARPSPYRNRSADVTHVHRMTVGQAADELERTASKNTRDAEGTKFKYLVGAKGEKIWAYQLEPTLRPPDRAVTMARRIRDIIGREHFMGWNYFPNVACNHKRYAPSGFVVSADRETSTPICTSMIAPERLSWGTLAIQLSADVSNPIIETIKASDQERIKNELLRCAFPEDFFSAGSAAYAGLFIENSRESGWTPRLWLLAHGGSPTTSKRIWDTFHKIQSDAAFARDGTLDDSYQIPVGCGYDDAEKSVVEDTPEGETPEDVLEEDARSAQIELEQRVKYKRKVAAKEASWQRAFHLAGHIPRARDASSKNRWAAALAVIQHMGIVDGCTEERLRSMDHVETVTNTFFLDAVTNTYVYAGGGVTHIEANTNAMVFGENPVLGPIILKGPPYETIRIGTPHQLGQPWRRWLAGHPPQHYAYGAFPCCTGRLRSQREPVAEAPEVPPAYVFDSSGETGAHQRFSQDMYRKLTPQFWECLKHLGWDASWGRIDLKPYVVRCAPPL